MTHSLKGNTSLVTGASRGIGAATAIKLAQLGSDIILNYRSKASRALDIASDLKEFGVRVTVAQADITVPDESDRLVSETTRFCGQLDYLILNASGGLEKDRAEDYAMILNRDAQLNLAKRFSVIMPPESRIVFVTSHWAHYYGQKPVMPEYEIVAKTKRAGEDALREYSTELNSKGISLVVVSGDLIEGTITPKLLQRQAPGMIEARRKDAGGLPTVDDFATAIVNAAIDKSIPTGHTLYVGSTDY